MTEHGGAEPARDVAHEHPQDETLGELLDAAARATEHHTPGYLDDRLNQIIGGAAT